MMVDAVYVLARGLQDLAGNGTIDTYPLSCDRVQSWRQGSSLFNYINAVSYTLNYFPFSESYTFFFCFGMSSIYLYSAGNGHEYGN